MSERTTDRAKEMDRFEADIAAVAAENAAGGKKNGKAPEKLPAITGQEAQIAKIRALVASTASKPREQLDELQKSLNGLGEKREALQEALDASASRVELALIDLITAGINVETVTAVARDEANNMGKALDSIRAQHARVVGTV